MKNPYVLYINNDSGYLVSNLMAEDRVMAQLLQLLLQFFERLNQLSPSASALVALVLIFGIVVVLKI